MTNAFHTLGECRKISRVSVLKGQITSWVKGWSVQYSITNCLREMEKVQSNDVCKKIY